MIACKRSPRNYCVVRSIVEKEKKCCVVLSQLKASFFSSVAIAEDPRLFHTHIHTLEFEPFISLKKPTLYLGSCAKNSKCVAKHFTSTVRS